MSISSHGPKICLGDLNSRLYCRLAGENEIIGPYFFSNGSKQLNSNMNRFLLLETCARCDLQIANTFIKRANEKQVTYYELTANPADTVTPNKFAELDVVLIGKEWLQTIVDIQSCRNASLASHHFLVICVLDVVVPKIVAPQNKFYKLDVAQLNCSANAQVFSAGIIDQMQSSTSIHTDIEQIDSALSKTFQDISAKQLPPIKKKPQKPWISPNSLNLIHERDVARQSKDWEREK